VGEITEQQRNKNKRPKSRTLGPPTLT
jgi:hypothetical protein